MPTTLGELHETADRNLRAAATARVFVDSRGHAVATRLLGELVGHLQSTLESSGERSRRVNPGPATHLATAQSALRRASARMPALDDEAVLSSGPLAQAVQAVAGVRDLIASHRGQDGVPVTPYAFAFTEQSARAYLVRCSADLAWGAARVAQALGETTTIEAVGVQLYVARGSLDLASVFARAASGDGDRAFAAFPLALPLSPRLALPADETRSIPSYLADDCERLSRTAFEALHSRGERGLSGSDLQQMARWRAMTNLLAGRTLLHAAAHAGSGSAGVLQETAGRFRTAAQAWQQVAARWHRIVDLADPRVHPKLPLPSYDLVHSGQFTPMPKTPPHPAVVTAQANATRVGQLLYGATWTPEAPARPAQRDAREVLADVGGVAGLTQTAYRVSATGWQLAVAMPSAVRRIESTLVTDSIDHRPPDAGHRFYPLPDHQTKRLTERYEQVTQAERAVATSILRAAPRTGMDTARAHLDAAAHKLIRSGQPWLPLDMAAEERRTSGTGGMTDGVESARLAQLGFPGVPSARGVLPEHGPDAGLADQPERRSDRDLGR
ncbi:hypothetical protein [Streptomyces sp. NPDC002324]